MNWKAVVNALMAPVIQHRALFLFSVLISNVICWVGLIKGVDIDAFISFLLPVFDSYVFCLLACLFNKLKLRFLIWVVVVFIGLGELFTVCHLHTLFNPSIAGLMMETSVKESSEFLLTVLFSWDFWIVSLIISVVGAISCLIVKISITSDTLKYGITMVISILILWSSSRQVPEYIKLVKCYASQSTTYCANDNNFPELSGTAVRLIYGIIWNQISSDELEKLEKSVESLSVDSCSFRCPFVVVVIGESYNKHHSQLFEDNYLPTTPFMVKRFESGNLIPYWDVVSKYNITSDVFRSIFGTFDDDDNDEWTDHSLVTALFRKAGYEVFFYSNQFLIGSNDMWSILGGTIFNNGKLSAAQFTSRNKKVYYYDEGLLNELPSDELMSHPTLLIVHLLGQHVKYTERYPESFKKFSPSSSKTFFGGKQGKRIAAEYDNATLYNDWFVDQIVSRFDSVDAICLYFADHGEEVFDWRNEYGRTQEEVITPEIAKYQFEIPMMFFLSDKFRANHPDITEQVKAGADRPLISSDISNILLYLGGIETKEYKPHRNILLPEYVPRKRLLRGTQDYDELMSGK